MSEKQPDQVDVFVGNKIRALRKDRRMSQADLADALGVTFQQVQKYERGANRISASMMFRAAEALGVSPTVFFPESHGAGKAETLTEVHQLVAAPGGLELARYYLRLKGLPRESLLSVARALAGLGGLNAAIGAHG